MTVGRAGETLTLEALAPADSASPSACGCGTAAARREIRLPLLGAYQAANALVAAGLAMATGERAGPRAAGAREPRTASRGGWR